MPTGKFDVDALLAKARAWPGLEGMDLAKEVSCRQMYRWAGGRWALGSGYGERERGRERARTSSRSTTAPSATSSATSPTPARG